MYKVKRAALKNREDEDLEHNADDDGGAELCNISLMPCWCQCLLCLGAATFIISVQFGLVVYTAFVIRSLCLTSFREQRHMCPTSDAWLYLLLHLLGNCIGVPYCKKQDLDREDITATAEFRASFTVGIAFMIWGCVELFHTRCDDAAFYHTLLYKMLQVTVIIDLCLTIVGLCIVGAKLIVYYHRKYRNSCN